MRLHSESSKNHITFRLDPSTRKIGVSDFVLRSHLPFADEDYAADGPELLLLKKCENRKEFIREMNKSKFLHVSLHADVFSVQDCSGLLGESPAGIYKSELVDKRISIKKALQEV